LDAAQKTKYDVNPASKVQVETLALDDLIDSLPSGSHVFLAKIDVQGHEASVFEGMQKSISQGKIRYILFEYWVDALDQAAGLPTGSCSSVNTILRPLYNAGYSLYDLSVLFHPGANDKSTQMANWKKWFRPVDAQEHCEWFANLGKRGREELNYGNDFGCALMCFAISCCIKLIIHFSYTLKRWAIGQIFWLYTGGHLVWKSKGIPWKAVEMRDLSELP